MPKDLFAVLFNAISRWSFDEYFVNFIERLPYRFMQGALTANAELRDCLGFTELQQTFASQAGCGLRNPELYPHLNRIMIPGYPFLQKHVDALKIHVGLRSLTSAVEPEPRFWRLRDPTPEIVEVDNRAVRNVDGLLIPVTLSQPFPFVYRPYPNLFDDVEKNLYRGNGFQDDPKELACLITDAMQLINRYSTDITVGFCRVIGTIAFMVRQPGQAKSFSLRNFYIGGIFVSICDPIMLAEQLIHEYYHQCIWPWWMIEPPTDLPNDDRTIVSPITGRLRPVSVMIQALLIYCSLIDFYRFVLSAPECNGHEPSQISGARTRLSKLESGAKPLVTALESALLGCPNTRSIVDVIAGTLKI